MTLTFYTAACNCSLTASYYAYQCYLDLIRNIGVYLLGYPVHTNMLTRYPQDGHAKKIAVRSGITLTIHDQATGWSSVFMLVKS